MSSFLASRFAPVFVGLGLLLFAGSARAQFEECVTPNQVPLAVFETILDQADLDFGALPEKVCNSITKKSVSTCKAQAKGANKCFKRAFDTNYAISVKQCQQLEDSTDRADCKAASKEERNGNKAELDSITDAAIATCEGEFEGAIFNACMGILEEM